MSDLLLIRPGAVSEVGRSGDILLAFAAMQDAGRDDRAAMEHDAHAKTSPVIPVLTPE